MKPYAIFAYKMKYMFYSVKIVLEPHYLIILDTIQH